jgi:hypothetical protein
MDYYDGIQLIVDITHKSHFYGQFNGRMKSMADKLAYEICKAAGVADAKTWIKFIKDVKEAPDTFYCEPVSTTAPPASPIKPTTGQAPDSGILPPLTDGNKNQLKVFTPGTDVDLKSETLDENPLKEYPAIIRRIIHEYAAMFQERSKLHAVMAEMDPSNAPAVMERRSELFDLIKGLSVRLEQFYQAKSKFEIDGTLPLESELFPVEDNSPGPDINTLDEVELKKRKKNLQNSNSKDQSLLDYQSKDHGQTKNPMPAGPKRIKIEYRLVQRAKLIEEIDTALLKYVVKN